jgi:hypothetical protein
VGNCGDIAVTEAYGRIFVKNIFFTNSSKGLDKF